eukprot:TRINITY_DN553_c1_g1_i2.p1 TRINITY_DN553_c1_g1~~TRINITY_DN553_c1_g1_i2.p1  ORF type:complete len:141 (-),score=3.51 TRINITY_DN553_c1_g1_i2:104-526(-)
MGGLTGNRKGRGGIGGGVVLSCNGGVWRRCGEERVMGVRAGEDDKGELVNGVCGIPRFKEWIEVRMMLGLVFTIEVIMDFLDVDAVFVYVMMELANAMAVGESCREEQVGRVSDRKQGEVLVCCVVGWLVYLMVFLASCD